MRRGGGKEVEERRKRRGEEEERRGGGGEEEKRRRRRESNLKARAPVFIHLLLLVTALGSLRLFYCCSFAQGT